MVKHPACAAPSSSSGLVPMPFSKRVLKEYCVWLRTPLWVEMVPLPSFRPPAQCALAVRCISPPANEIVAYPHYTIVRGRAVGTRAAEGRDRLTSSCDRHHG